MFHQPQLRRINDLLTMAVDTSLGFRQFKQAETRLGPEVQGPGSNLICRYC